MGGGTCRSEENQQSMQHQPRVGAIWEICVVTREPVRMCYDVRPGVRFYFSLSLLTKLVTARKRSLRRLCFHRCLSVHRGGVCTIACWGTAFLGRHQPGRHLPGQTPPWADTPSSTMHAGIWSTNRRYASHWNAFLLVSTYVVCERLFSRIFWPNCSEHPCSGIWFHTPAPPPPIET